MNFSIIIQFKYDSEDRLRNLIRGVIYLNHNFENDEIIIIDQDNDSQELYDILKDYILEIKNIKIISCNLNGPYHRSKIINIGLKEASNPICLIYDCDILIPEEQIRWGFKLCNEEYDIVFPYTTPQYDIPHFYFDKYLKQYDFKKTQKEISPRQSGVFNDDLFIRNGNSAFGMFVNKNTLGNLAYFNENFNGWGYEDSEYVFRNDYFNSKITRVWGPVFHVEHDRTLQNQYKNYTNHNYNLYNNLRNMDHKQLIEYYSINKLINI